MFVCDVNKLCKLLSLYIEAYVEFSFDVKRTFRFEVLDIFSVVCAKGHPDTRYFRAYRLSIQNLIRRKALPGFTDPCPYTITYKCELFLDLTALHDFCCFLCFNYILPWNPQLPTINVILVLTIIS